MSNNIAHTAFEMRLLQKGYYLFDNWLIVAEIRCQTDQLPLLGALFP